MANDVDVAQVAVAVVGATVDVAQVSVVATVPPPSTYNVDVAAVSVIASPPAQPTIDVAFISVVATKLSEVCVWDGTQITRAQIVSWDGSSYVLALS